MSAAKTQTNGVQPQAQSDDVHDVGTLKQRLAAKYDDEAPRYDAVRSQTYELRAYFEHSYRTIHEWMGRTTQDSLHLDVPVGTGRFLFFLRDQGRKHRMVGIDISTGMLGVCRSLTQQKNDTITLAKSDVFHLPLADNSLDILTSLRLFHLFPRQCWRPMLAEMRRVLKPGGMLITEFRNRARGTVSQMLGRAFKHRRTYHPHFFVGPTCIPRLFAEWTEVTTCGMGLDGINTVQRVSPRLADAIHQLERCTPLRYMSKVLLLKARKPVTA